MNRIWMQEALVEAKIAAQKNEVPIGAVLIYNDTIIARAHNTVIQDCDGTAHAELKVLRAGFQYFNNYRFPKGVLLVTTLEPCPMCAGAMVHARVSQVSFALADKKAGAAGSVVQLLQHLSLNHIVSIETGLLEAESKTLLAEFFENRRR